MTVLLLRILIPSVSFFVKNDLPWVYQALSYLSSMSTPLAFLLVGADMDFSRSVRDIGKLAKVVLLKDLIFPILFLCAAFILHAADSVEYAILVSMLEADNDYYNEGIVDVCNKLAEAGIRVIVSGLDMDYLGNPFGPMPQLMAKDF